MASADLKYRLVAILAADAAGYSRLMAADERATVTALDAARAVFRMRIESNQGRVIDMAGDSVLAVFETATGAVSTALAIQDALAGSMAEIPEQRCLRFRIGVHMGDVFEKPDGTVYGDGVNIAARLQALAQPGGITVSESIRAAVKGKVVAGFEDQGEQTVKNIPDPVRAYRVGPEASPASKAKAVVGEIDLSLPDKPSIAVLPFTNMSGDAEQTYFTDGITEDIITELSRFRELFVIARNSSFTYRDRAVDVRTVGRELGVRYVLEGSIRRAGNRVRVTGQLIEAQTGAHLWAERYDRVLEDIFEVQEEITRSIVAAIAPQIGLAEANRTRRRTGSPGAYELGVRARQHADEAQWGANRGLAEEAIAEARQALAIDPGCLEALRAVAAAELSRVFFRMTPDLERSVRDGIRAAGEGIAIDPSWHIGYTLMGMLLISGRTGEGWDEALALMRRGQELNPNDAYALAYLGLAEAWGGDGATGVEHLRSAMRMSPRGPMLPWFQIMLASAMVAARDYEGGLRHARAGYQEARHQHSAMLLMAIAQVGLGDIAGARLSLAEIRRIAPDYVEVRVNHADAYPYRRGEDRERARTFIRIAAGLEDPGAAEGLR